MIIKIQKFEITEDEDVLFGERSVDYSINLIDGGGSVITVNIPDTIRVKQSTCGRMYLVDSNGIVTNVEEDNLGNLVIFDAGNYFPVKIINDADSKRKDSAQ